MTPITRANKMPMTPRCRFISQSTTSAWVLAWGNLGTASSPMTAMMATTTTTTDTLMKCLVYLGLSVPLSIRSILPWDGCTV